MTPTPLAAVVICLFCGLPPVEPLPSSKLPWELLPHPSVHRMANQARAIVEGTATAKGVVTVTKRYLVRPGDVVGATISVPSLAGMPKSAPAAGVIGGGRPAIKPDSVLLFLKDNPKGDEWVPVHLYGKAARGVLWFAKRDVWGYAQAMNPGGYSLTKWSFLIAKQRVPAQPKEVRDAVAKGVVGAQAWQDLLRIQDKAERARALMLWIDPATSPDGAWWRERLWPDCMRAWDELGEAAVKPLAHVVRVSANPDVVAAAVDGLRLLAGRARSATPSLIARLRDLRGAAPIPLLRAVHEIADRRAEHVLRDYVAHDDPFAAIEAARGLHRVGGKGVVDLLVARIPKEIVDRVALRVVASMLEVIHDIDPVRAEELVARHFLESDRLLKQRRWLRQIRDRDDRM